MNTEEVKTVWKNADAVCLDVDSTVCIDEGIDSLAAYCGVYDQVKEWTDQAMGGSVTFQESFDARLKILDPSCEIIGMYLGTHSPMLSPGINELVQKLNNRNCAVFLVSGGMLELILPAAQVLGIKKENIFANRLKYFFDGSYAGFDETCPTSRSGGKPAVVRLLKQKYNFKNLVMIGDGVTDMEAYPPADAFIGFGGNVVRDRVKEQAKWFVYSFAELIDALDD